MTWSEYVETDTGPLDLDEVIRWLVADGGFVEPARACVLISSAEFKAMQRMPGGVCWHNYLILRGIGELGIARES